MGTFEDLFTWKLWDAGVMENHKIYYEVVLLRGVGEHAAGSKFASVYWIPETRGLIIGDSTINIF